MFYALYIKPNGDNNGHLIYDLSREKITLTMNYRSVPVPEDLIEPMNRTESSNNKNQANHSNIKKSTSRVDYSNNNKYESRTPNNDKNEFEDRDTDELDNSQHLDDLMSNKIVDREDLVSLTKQSYNYTSVSVNRSTNINTPIPSFLQCLYKLQYLSLQYLHKAIITILCLHCLYKTTSTVVHLLSLVRVSLQMSIRENILHNFYKGISTFFSPAVVSLCIPTK